jgi:hypothetical protein
LLTSASRRKTTTVLIFAAALCLAFTGCHKSASGTEVAGAAGTVKATNPIAYYRLGATSGTSEVGSTTFSSNGGATVSSSCTPNKNCLELNGKDGWVTTTQKGGITTAASIMAWVDLAQLPHDSNHYFYVAGESQVGNDLDIQFENDNALRWYTAAGASLGYKPDPASLVGQWHMIVATMDTEAHTNNLYWDGKLVATNQDAGRPNKIATFSIGESTYFTGRHLHGSVDDVALWNRAITADEVAAIYKASK